MKRTIYCYLLFITVAWSCIRDVDDVIIIQPEEPFTIAQAKLWYETYGETESGKGFSNFRSGDSTYAELNPLLDWGLAELQEDSTWTVVELPWEYENGYVSIATPEVKDYLGRNDEKETPQVVRLVVMKNRTTGDIYGFKMVVIPDLDYMLSVGDDLEMNKYLSRDTGLSGLVMFYNLDDEFVNGWQYVDGQITGKIEKPDIEFSSSETAGAPRLRSSWGYITVETCYYYIVSADGGQTWSEPRLSGCTSKSYAVLLVDYSDYHGDGGGYSYGSGGGGGGNVTTNPVSNIAPKAKAILRNSNMNEENWKRVEDMITKIMEDCLGEGLYNGLKNALNGKTLTVEFTSGNSSSFFFDGATAGISLSMSGGSDHLFHEMWHGYQAYQETTDSFKNSLLNQEIEAWYAHYLYVSSLSEYKPGEKWYDLYNDSEREARIQNLKDYVDGKGKLLQDEVALYNYLDNGIKKVFNKNGYPDSSYPYDYNRDAFYNFRNLKNLSYNCD